MCGVFGSRNPKEFLDLYALNQKRGDFSVGFFLEGEDSFSLLKKKGIFFDTLSPQYNWYLGHTRAPTNNVTYFDFNESHPVQFGDWVVGHNGIISNFKELKSRNFYTYAGNLDSGIIPYLFQFRKNVTNSSEIDCIKFALEKLEGIFGCWIYNLKSKNLYLVRCASSLYCKEDGSAFSSAQVEDFIELKEGIIYRINNGIEEAGKFNYDSPYYIPGE